MIVFLSGLSVVLSPSNATSGSNVRSEYKVKGTRMSSSRISIPILSIAMARIGRRKDYSALILHPNDSSLSTKSETVSKFLQLRHSPDTFAHINATSEQVFDNSL